MARILFHDGEHEVKTVQVVMVGFDPDTLELRKYKFDPKPEIGLSEDRLRRTDTIDLDENILFSRCETVWDIEDTIESFWNRLNGLPTDWRGASIVKVLQVTR